jgi:hypothetical protein
MQMVNWTIDENERNGRNCTKSELILTWRHPRHPPCCTFTNRHTAMHRAPYTPGYLSRSYIL